MIHDLIIKTLNNSTEYETRISRTPVKSKVIKDSEITSELKGKVSLFVFH